MNNEKEKLELIQKIFNSDNMEEIIELNKKIPKSWKQN